jgi:hypothetical protein
VLNFGLVKAASVITGNALKHPDIVAVQRNDTAYVPGVYALLGTSVFVGAVVVTRAVETINNTGAPLTIGTMIGGVA